jgi:hypothetical protein
VHEGEVVVHLGGDRVGVAALRRAVDQLVLGAELVGALEREPVDAHIALRLRAQAVDECAHPGAVRSRVERPMELCVRGEPFPAQFPRGVHEVEAAAHLREVGGAQAWRRQPRDDRLQGEPHLVKLLEVRRRQLGHAGAQAGIADDQALGLQVAKRVADRHPADAEPLGERFLRQALARGQSPGEHVVANPRRDLLGERPGLELLRSCLDPVYSTPCAGGDGRVTPTGGGSQCRVEVGNGERPRCLLRSSWR